MKGFLVMDEYNFEPDYEAWWKIDGLSLNELFPMACGLCPEAYKQWRQAYEPEQRTPEQVEILKKTQEFYSKRDNDASVEDVMVWVEFFEKNKKWSGNKNTVMDLFYSDSFPQRIENNYLPSPHPDFIAYLKSISELPEYVEKYNDSYFDIGFNSLVIKEIADEDAAIAVLFACEIEPFKRWLKLASGQHPIENRTADDNAFWMECRKYFGSGSSIDDGGHAYHSYQIVKDLTEWSGDIVKYSESLFNEGVIYHAKTRSYLKANGARLEYSEDSWAYKFYQRWLENDLWTLEQSRCLFKGECPDAGRYYLDFSQGKFSAYGLDWIKNKYTGKFDIKITDAVQDSIDAGVLFLASNRGGKLRFKPKDIVEWFLNKTEHVPPKPLLKLLGVGKVQIRDEYSNEKVAESVRKLKPEKPSKAYELADIKKQSLLFLDEYHKTHAKLPTKKNVVKHLQGNGYGMSGEESLNKKFTMRELKGEWRSSRKLG